MPRSAVALLPGARGCPDGPAPNTAAAVGLPVGLLVGAAVLLQLGSPLLPSPARTPATVIIVLLTAAAVVAHQYRCSGPRAALALLAVGGGATLAVEAVGVRTGWPFGPYHYTDALGPQLLGVPLLIPFAWLMTAGPALFLGRRLGRDRVRTALAGGAALAGWDLLLDPRMVGAGYWQWEPTGRAALPGVPGIPWTNYAGWVVVSIALIALLDAVLPVPGPGHDGVPALLLAWSWVGSTVGNLVFFGHPWAACYGFVAMGATVGPYLLAVGRARSGAPDPGPAAAA